MFSVIPEAPQGTDLAVFVYALLAFVVLIGLGIRWGVKQVERYVKPMAHQVTAIEDATNHSKAGEPTLQANVRLLRTAVDGLARGMVELREQGNDHAKMCATIEQLDSTVVSMQADVTALKLWSNHWNNALPPELADADGLVTRFDSIATEINDIKKALAHHVEWEEEHKWSDIETQINDLRQDRGN
jgi:uncharacterized protein YoxC